MGVAFQQGTRHIIQQYRSNDSKGMDLWVCPHALEWTIFSFRGPELPRSVQYSWNRQVKSILPSAGAGRWRASFLHLIDQRWFLSAEATNRNSRNSLETDLDIHTWTFLWIRTQIAITTTFPTNMSFYVPSLFLWRVNYTKGGWGFASEEWDLQCPVHQGLIHFIAISVNANE